MLKPKVRVMGGPAAKRGVLGIGIEVGHRPTSATTIPECGPGGMHWLTPRQQQVLRLIAEGLTNSQAAAQMHLSIHTIVKHRQAVMDFLHIHDTAGLTRFALAQGLTLRQRACAALLKFFHTRGGYPLVCGRNSSSRTTVTPRQLQVVRLIANGLVNKQLAATLKISIKTVEHHRQAAMDRLHIHHVAGLTRYAVAAGLLPPAGALRASAA